MCETGTVRGRLVWGRKEQMSESTSGYHQKGTQELSEVRVGAGPGSLPILGFFPL